MAAAAAAGAARYSAQTRAATLLVPDRGGGGGGGGGGAGLSLAPPPSHSTKPAKPSRKVILAPGHSPLDWARLSTSRDADLRGLPPGTPYLRVTPSMLQARTGRKGKEAWTALGGRVYNIGPYLPFHPGGEPELMRCAGRDGTVLFGEVHPWVNYENMLEACLVGIMVQEHEATATANGSGAMDEMD
jgi:cytochrome b involved in lipid metabolism